MNSDISQSILNLDADVNADVPLGIYQHSFGIGSRFAEIWVVPNRRSGPWSFRLGTRSIRPTSKSTLASASTSTTTIPAAAPTSKSRRISSRLSLLTLLLCTVFAATVAAQEVLPFPPTPSASKAGLTIQDSTYQKRVEPKRLADGAPNILIILIDDIGPATASTYGGEINTPTLDRIAKLGISYNRFHTTAMCSPTRAALLTGRNHTRVGNGQIAALANDFDGFSGVIPKSSATVAEVLKNYGYSTGAWGKWHNTPEEHVTSMGPFDTWPTGYGFEYFYGFMAGEASQYEPQMVRNTAAVNPHEIERKGYHLTEDIAEDAIKWLREQNAYAPDKPFFMYWAPGAVHGPHHIMKEWADKYKGKFDDGWDKYRERAFANAKAKGWIPRNAQLTPRPATMASWDSIPEAEKPFQRRLMEVYAGFTEHADYNAGRVIGEIERQGKLDNTLIFYIWGDNGSSAEGLNGTISEQLAQNGIPTTIPQHIKALDELGGLDALGGPQTDNMYNAGWAWAGSTPYQGTKLMGAYFGGIRNPMAVSWPKGIQANPTARPQFHHVIDIAPTIYEVTKITPPKVVNGIEQDSIDGVSMVYSFADAQAKGQRATQFFDIMASRGIYHDGWFASAPGLRQPWVGGIPKGVREWSPLTDKWELYHIDEDWSQANDMAASNPQKLEEMKALFIEESKKNKNMPIGGGLWSTAMYHPEDAPRSSVTEWTFEGAMTGMSESAAPKLGIVDTVVSMEVDMPANASGVLYALGGFSGGLALYVKNGVLNYEYNLFEVARTKIKSSGKLPTGKVKIEVESALVDKVGGAMDIKLKANRKVVGQGQVPTAISLHFTTNESLDFGSDTFSPVSLAYYDQAPFAFNGSIGMTKVMYPKK
ncbi:MAG TPA: arylsulfatase [Methylococcaceae bacterium]|nr:arylsulfatase [Methylococcaceae bacterium]